MSMIRSVFLPSVVDAVRPTIAVIFTCIGIGGCNQVSKEPSEEDLRAAVEKIITIDNPLNGIRAEIAHLRKLACVQAKDKPGFICDYSVNVKISVHSNEGNYEGTRHAQALNQVLSILNNGGPPKERKFYTARFVPTGSGWVRVEGGDNTIEVMSTVGQGSSLPLSRKELASQQADRWRGVLFGQSNAAPSERDRAISELLSKKDEPWRAHNRNDNVGLTIEEFVQLAHSYAAAFPSDAAQLRECFNRLDDNRDRQIDILEWRALSGAMDRCAKK